MSRLCAECGVRAVEPRAVPGRRTAYRHFVSLPIPADLPIPTCANCGAEWLDRRTSERLDAALAEAAAQQLSGLAVEALEVLSVSLNQRDLEALLGLSAGYLSKVRHVKERPSAPLVSLLALLADRPARLGEIARIWDTGHLPPRLTVDNVTLFESRVDSPAAVAC